VEYKVDSLTNTPYLMEINGRFWGSLQLAVDAGVDFPRLLADVSLGGSVASVTDYRFVRSRWSWGDFDHLIARWREPGSTWSSRARAFGTWLSAFAPGYKDEVFRWSDPRPFLRESAEWLRDIARR